MNGNRLKNALEAKGLTQVNLACFLGVNPTSVSRWVNGDRNPRDNLKKKIADYLDVTVGYLMGDERTENSSSVVQQLEETKNALTNFGEGNKQHIKIVNDLMRVPVVSREMTACCGSGIGALDITSDSGEDPVWISRSELRTYDDMRPPFAIYADGDCLESDGIKSDDKVIINPAEEPQNGSIVLVSIYGMLSLKRYYQLTNGTVALRSDTGEQQLSPEKQEDANFSVVGVLVGFFRGRPRLRSY